MITRGTNILRNIHMIGQVGTHFRQKNMAKWCKMAICARNLTTPRISWAGITHCWRVFDDLPFINLSFQRVPFLTIFQHIKNLDYQYYVCFVSLMLFAAPHLSLVGTLHTKNWRTKKNDKLRLKHVDIQYTWNRGEFPSFVNVLDSLRSFGTWNRHDAGACHPEVWQKFYQSWKPSWTA